MNSLPSQLLQRNLEHFETGAWAIVNAPDTGLFSKLSNQSIVGFHQFFHHYEDCLQNTQHKQVFSASFTLEDVSTIGSALDGAVIYMPKSKQQLSMLIENLAALIKPNGSLFVVGANKEGIKSVPKLLEKYSSVVNKVDSAKHCGLYVANIEHTGKVKAFDLDTFGIVRDYKINDCQLSVFSLPGVFGHKQLDPGTELLLQQLTPQNLSKSSGQLYDFACGTGVIACYIAKTLETSEQNIKSKYQISMSDVSALAVYCANKTAELNQLKIKVSANNGLVQEPEKYNLIVSNPPFHEGIQNDYSITENFIKQAFRYSKPYAKIIIVANKFLPYQDILSGVYGRFNELATTSKYRIYQAEKSKS